MNAANAPLCRQLLRLCMAHDPRLRQAIADCKIDTYPDGMVLLVLITTGQTHCFLTFMPWLTAQIKRLGRFKSIAVQAGDRMLNFLMSDLTFPANDHDRADTLSLQAVQDRQWFNALLPYLTRQSHVFLLSLDGIYREIWLQQDSPATIPAAAMLGQPLAPFIGAAAAAYLICELGLAYEQGEARSLEYAVVHPSGEPRLYGGMILPIAGTETCILLSSRVRRVSPLHSLTAPE